MNARTKCRKTRGVILDPEPFEGVNEFRPGTSKVIRSKNSDEASGAMFRKPISYCCGEVTPHYVDIDLKTLSPVLVRIF